MEIFFENVVGLPFLYIITSVHIWDKEELNVSRTTSFLTCIHSSYTTYLLLCKKLFLFFDLRCEQLSFSFKKYSMNFITYTQYTQNKNGFPLALMVPWPLSLSRCDTNTEGKEKHEEIFICSKIRNQIQNGRSIEELKGPIRILCTL